jgi:hypothetical protein
MPLVGKASPGPPPDGASIFRAGLGSPFRNSLERDLNDLRHDAGSAESKIEPHCMGDDLGGKTITLVPERRNTGRWVRAQVNTADNVNATLPIKLVNRSCGSATAG